MDNSDMDNSDMDNKFPARTVMILTLCTTLNSYTLVNLFPYVGLMVKDLLGLETTNELGYYAGYVASAFTFGRFVGSYPLGYTTDSVGRKPVIVGGLLSIMAFSLAFGLSPTFGFAVSIRLLLGLTNGIVPALTTTVREACGDQHVFEGMTYLGGEAASRGAQGGRSVSLVLGTGIGGLLAQPAVSYPSLFSDSGVFGSGSRGAAEEAKQAAPEEAPNSGATSGRSNVARRGGLAYQPMMDEKEGEDSCQKRVTSPDLELQETDGSMHNITCTKRSDGNCDVDGDGIVMKYQDQEQPGLWGQDGVLAVPNVKMVLILVCVTKALVIGLEESYPLWALSTPDVGGLGWGTVDIGKVLFAAGLVVAVLQLVVFPRVIKVLKITIFQRVGCLLAVPAFIVVPYAKVLSWSDSSLFVMSVTSTSLVYCFMSMVNIALTIASSTMVESVMRGKLGGLFNMGGSLGRTVGAAGSATLFAWSVSPSSYHWVGHEFVFLAAALSMVLVTILAWGTITDKNMIRAA